MKWYVGAGLLLAIALFLELELLAYSMYVLLALLLVTRFLARNWMQYLTADRSCKTLTAEIGDSVPVSVTVSNEGWMPVPWVIVEDLLPKHAMLQRPPRLRLDGRRLKIAFLGSRKKTTVRYRLNIHMRGYYQIGPLVMESGDLFGLHRRYRLGAEPHFLLVFPRVVPLEGYDIASRRPIGEIRLVHRLYEDPTRIAGVRFYQAGDPLNRVHWHATARTGVLHSKVYEPSTIAGATVVLDFHAASYPSRGEPYRSELAVSAAASVANALYQLGQQVGLVTNGRDTADRIREEGWDADYRTRKLARSHAAMQERSDRLQPLVVKTRRGPDQLLQILETLARVELTDGLRFAELVVETASRMPRDASVVAILGSVEPESAMALGNLRRQGYAVTAVLVRFPERESEEAYARLAAEDVDVRWLADENDLAHLCQEYLLH